VPAADAETRAYLDDMRLEMRRRFDGVDRRFDGIDGRLDGVDRRFVELEAELRRHFGVLIEQIRHELQLVAEMVVATTGAISLIRARLGMS
jgi:hypothetical protein